MDKPSAPDERDEIALAQERLAAIVESSDDAILSKDLNGIITSWNRAAERMFGYAAADAIGRSIMLIVPSDRRAEEQAVLDRVRTGRRVHHFETIRQRRDGSPIEVAIAVSPVRDGHGVIVGAATIGRDITDRKREERVRDELLARERAARAEAVAARDRLAFLSDITALLSSSLDYEATLQRAVNLALPRLGDYCVLLLQDDNGALKLVACNHVAPEREPMVRAVAERFVVKAGGVPTFSSEILRTGRPRIVPRILESAEFRTVQATQPDLLTRFQGFRPCSFLGVPLLVRGRVAGVMSFGTEADLSCHEYTEADLPLIEEFARRVSLSVENARLFGQADQLNRLKDEFLATLSHELRTPLNAILGWSRLLAAGKLKSDTVGRAVDAIERNARAQAKIVDDILDVARGIAGNLRLELTPLDLVEAVHRGVDSVIPAAAAKHIGIDFIPAAAHVPISADRDRLEQIIGNLLSNAVKFTPDGGHVRVDVRQANGEAELSITDTGIGIPAHFLPHVFDKFRQADGSHTRPYSGLGLGLAITRHLVELHGGVVEARSEGRNKGATFIVRLPLYEPR